MSSFNVYMKKHSPFLPLGIGMSIFGLLWVVASFQVAESWWFVLLIIGAIILGVGIFCFVMGLIATLEAKKKKE